MTVFLIDYHIACTLLLLIACFGRQCFREPTRRLVLTRIVLLLLIVSAVLLLVPNRPRVSLRRPIQQHTPATVVANSDPEPVRQSEVVPNLEFDRHEFNSENHRPVPFQIPDTIPEVAFQIPYTQFQTPTSESGFIRESIPRPAVIEVMKPVEVVPQEAESKTATQPWLRINSVALIVGAYLTGVGLVGIWLILGVIHLRGLLRHAQNAPAEMAALFARMTPHAWRTRVCVSPKIAAPIVTGTLRPTILIPESFWKERRKNRDKGLRFALAHEWGHIRNGDLWFLAIYRLLALVLFPNPLFWWLGRRMREDQELLADAHAAAMTLEQNEQHPMERENRRLYALELVRWSRRANASMFHAAGLTLAIAEIPVSRCKTTQNNKSFTRRIDMLLDEKQLELKTPRRWKLLAILLLASAMAAFSMLTLQPRTVIVAAVTDAIDQIIVAEKPLISPDVSANPGGDEITDIVEPSSVTDEIPLSQPELPQSPPGQIHESPDGPTAIIPAAYQPDRSDVIDDSKVGNPFASRILKTLHDEMVGGLKSRNVTGRFNTWRGYMNSTLNNTNEKRTGTEVNALARLSWYEELYRDPLTSVSKAEQFSRYIHAGLSSGNSMQLAEVMYAIREKLDVRHQINVTWVEQKREGQKNIVVNPDNLGVLVDSVSTQQPDPHEIAIHELAYRISSAKSGYQKAVSTLTPAELNTLNTQIYNALCANESHGHTFKNNLSAVRMLDLLLKMDRRETHYAAAPLVTLYNECTLESLKHLDPNRLESVTIDGQLMHQLVIPEGRILVGGRENHTYKLDDPGMMDVVCVIDLGGNDTYYEGTCTPDRPVLVIIDLDGDDQYIATKPGVQGGSLLGISMLIDCAGNDTYHAVDVAQGSSIGGIGMLIDKGGNDSYHGLRRAQGAAFGGVGMLIDLDGNDTYHAAMWSQGFGHSAGFGVLEDANGRDHYYLGGLYEDSYPEHPGYEGWGQGLGAGFRGSAGSACGGIGIMLDGGGDDTYEFDYIAHGGGYWLGVGMMRDFGGNDRHIGSTALDYYGKRRSQAQWQQYGNGFGCHYALGFLFDDDGGDIYEGNNLGMGMGWNLSVGYLCDFTGNDTYQSRGELMQGVGAQASLGVLLDRFGDDIYTGGSQGSASPTMDPKYHNIAQAGGNFSFLVDYDGTDKYSSGMKNNSYNHRGSDTSFLIDRSLETEARQPETDALAVPEKMTFTVLDEDGQPLSNVELFLNIWGGDITTTFREKIKSDENGIVVFDLGLLQGKQFGPFRLWVSAPGYVTLFRNWDRLSPPYPSIPAELTFAMSKAVTFSGQVVNEDGEPIEGVDVNISGEGTDQTPPVAPGFGISTWIVEDGKTDSEGKWRCDNIPKHAKLRFGFKHSDYMNVEYSEYRPQEGMTEDKLQNATAVYVMQPGTIITGTVTDENGQPISGVTVRIGSNDMINYWGNKASTTDEQGKYAIGWKTGTFPIMASASGKAPELRMLTVTDKNNPVDFVLQPGKTIKLKVSNEMGNPVPDAYVTPLRWRGTEGYFGDKIKGNDKTDADGNWVWNEAPTDSVQIFVGIRGMRSEQDGYLVEPREEPYTVTMLPKVRVTGRVIDATTKKPIPKFSIYPGYKWSENYRDPLLQSTQGKEFQNGSFDFEVEYQNFGYNLRVAADGYVPVVSETWTVEQGNQTRDFELVAAPPITGILLLPNGKPAENAKIQLISSVSGSESIWNNALRDRTAGHPLSNNGVQTTQADGRFTFSVQKEGYVIVAVHDAGVVQAYPDEFIDGTITLKPWARIEGVVKKGAQPWPDRTVMVAAWLDCETWDRDRPDVQFIYTTKSDAEGKFVVEQVVPGRQITAFWEEELPPSLLDHFAPSVRSGTVKLTLEPGQTQQVQIGGTGRPVIGKIVDTGKFRDKINWEFAEITLNGVPTDMEKPDLDSLPVPANIDRKDLKAFNAWYQKWVEEDEAGKQFIEARRQYDAARPVGRGARVDSDGSFRVEDVPPGRYDFHVWVFQPKPLEDIPSAQGGEAGGDIGYRLSLSNGYFEPVIEVPAFDGVQTDVCWV